jgi:hypothetical protein
MNKFKINNNRQPGNSPGKFVDEENSLNVANLSGNQLGNESGFDGGSPSEKASFARNANVTTPTNPTESGFGQARQSNPDGGDEGGSEQRTLEAGATTKANPMQKLAAIQKLKRFGGTKNNKMFAGTKNDKMNFKNNTLNTMKNTLALDKKMVKSGGSSISTSANTNRIA